MLNKTLFEIPIYRKSIEDLEKQYEARREQSISDTEARWPAQEYGVAYRDSSEFIRNSQIWRDTNNPPYPYNDVIGFLRLEVQGTQLVAHHYQRDSSKFGRYPKGQFKDMQNFTWKLDLIAGESTSAFLARLERWIGGITKDSGATKRFYDTTAFWKIAPFVDWSSLISNHLEDKQRVTAC